MGLTLDAKGLDLENVVDNKFDIKRTIAILTQQQIEKKTETIEKVPTKNETKKPLRRKKESKSPQNPQKIVNKEKEEGYETLADVSEKITA